MKNTIKYSLLSGLLFLLNISTIFAQCPMCRGAAEANLKEGGTHALGLNTGIIYLFLIPYICVMTLIIVWWWKNRKTAPST